MPTSKLSCLIVEDEPIAAEVLQDYIAEVPFLELQTICKDAVFALDVLNSQAIDVLFLDIHLPKLKGLAFLSMLPNRPQTILTTAYHQYTLQAFEEGVVDYLMKPIAFSRFMKAVNRLSFPDAPKPKADTFLPNRRAFRFFNVNKKKVKVYDDEILYIESLKDYSRIVTLHAKLVVRGQIGAMQDLFGDTDFLRIHRSFMVSLPQITAYNATEIEVTGKALPIGRSYKEWVSKRLAEYF
ncbi:MAG: LytTR family DNA-binding domain-containing protein [Bacteroidota bacterium]